MTNTNSERRYSTVYEIFVDRFEPGGEIPPVPERSAVEGTVRRPFGSVPDKAANGRDLQGGTLHGIAQRLDHVASLADAIYLTPITRAPSNHKYDASDLHAVDEHFGGERAFDALLAATKSRQLDVFVDAVFNHVGSTHPWALDPSLKAHFRGAAWRGYHTLPELDVTHGAVRAALLGAGGVVDRFIRRGVAGMRIDCANDLGPAFCGEISSAIARAGGAGGAIGEVMSWPAELLGPGALDGVMNYWLRSALEAALRDDAHISVAARALDRLAAAVPIGKLLRCWTILSSHDTPRISDQVGFDETLARFCLAMQFAYPGTPMIYYGEEVGMKGGMDPGCRRGMSWDESTWDKTRLDFVRRLVQLRRTLPALTDGEYVSIDTPPSVIAFARTTKKLAETLICVANPSARPTLAMIPISLPGLYASLPLDDVLGGPPTQSMSGWLHLSLPPRTVRWLMPRDDDRSGYRFLKSPSL